MQVITALLCHCASLQYAYVEHCRNTEKQKFKAWLRDAPASPVGPAPLTTKREANTYTVEGVSRTVEGWADHIGISRSAVVARMKKFGSMEAAVSAGIGNMRGKRIVTLAVDGEARTLQQWADCLGITYLALSQRIHTKGSLEAAILMGGPQRRGRASGVVSDLSERVGTGVGRHA